MLLTPDPLMRYGGPHHADLTCTRHKRRRQVRMKSKRSLSPQGLATPKPRLMALRRNASSAISPRRLTGKLADEANGDSTGDSCELSKILAPMKKARLRSRAFFLSTNSIVTNWR